MPKVHGNQLTTEVPDSHDFTDGTIFCGLIPYVKYVMLTSDKIFSQLFDLSSLIFI